MGRQPREVRVLRIPEPDLMDKTHQALAYSQADFAVPHNAFVELAFERFGPMNDVTHWLDLGCGPCDITVRWAHRFTEHHIDGVDGAAAMLDLARKRVAENDLGDRICLKQAFLPDDTPPGAEYEGVFSNSLLHHLSQPLDLWRAIKAYGKINAKVFVMDLLRPEDETQLERLVTTYAKGEPEVLVHDFRASLFAAYRLEEVQSQLSSLGLSTLKVEAISDRHLLVTGLLPSG